MPRDFLANNHDVVYHKKMHMSEVKVGHKYRSKFLIEGRHNLLHIIKLTPTEQVARVDGSTQNIVWDNLDEFIQYFKTMATRIEEREYQDNLREFWFKRDRKLKVE